MAGSDDKSVRRPCHPGPMDRDLADRLRAMASHAQMLSGDLDSLRNAVSLLVEVIAEDRRRRTKCELRK